MGLKISAEVYFFHEEFESALRSLNKSKAIFSVCDVITTEVYWFHILGISKWKYQNIYYEYVHIKSSICWNIL